MNPEEPRPARLPKTSGEEALHTYRQRFVESVNAGLADIAAGRVHSARAVKQRLRKLAETWRRR